MKAQAEYKLRIAEEARKKKERAIARAQLTKSGFVYVISNIGSFGECVRVVVELPFRFAALSVPLFIRLKKKSLVPKSSRKT